MTEKEITSILTLMSTNYSKTLNGALIKLWYDFFKDFELKTFQSACQKVMAMSEYFPKVSEVIATYKELQEQKKKAQYEKMRANHRLLAQKQADCFLCNNSGICTYRRNDYEYAARCICDHGKDLNKFSRAEIDEQYQSTEKNTKAYIPTIKEALREDFTVYEVQKKAQKLGNRNLSDEDKLKILQGSYVL